MYTSITVKQFRRRFRSERDCLKFLIKRKWPDGFRCPRCGHQKAYLIESRKLYQCTACRHQTSVTAGTMFHKTQKPLRDWFWAIFVVATRSTGSSARQLQYDLGIAYQTAWTWCHKIRTAMQSRESRYLLGGVVELDETYVGGKKKPGKRGRGAAGKVPVMVGVESRPKGCGHVSLSKAKPLTSLQAMTFAHQTISSHSAVITDNFPIYRCLTVQFSLTQVKAGSQTSEPVLPRVHRVMERLKSWIRGTHCHVSPKHLNRYLAEFAYRFNRRFKHRRSTIFDRLVTACCLSKAITYRQLVAEVNG